MFWAKPSDRRVRPEAAGVEANAPVGEVGRSSRRAGAVPLRPDLPVDDWAALLACRFRLLAEPWRGSRSPRDPRFMNPTEGNTMICLSEEPNTYMSDLRESFEELSYVYIFELK